MKYKLLFFMLNFLLIAYLSFIALLLILELKLWVLFIGLVLMWVSGPNFLHGNAWLSGISHDGMWPQVGILSTNHRLNIINNSNGNNSATMTAPVPPLNNNNGDNDHDKWQLGSQDA